MIAIIIFYPKMARWTVRNNQLTDAQMAKIINRKWIIIICVLYEVLIVHNLLSFAINWLIQI